MRTIVLVKRATSSSVKLLLPLLSVEEELVVVVVSGFAVCAKRGEAQHTINKELTIAILK
jgi:hypothetical protein